MHGAILVIGTTQLGNVGRKVWNPVLGSGTRIMLTMWQPDEDKESYEEWVEQQLADHLEGISPL